MGNMKMLRSKIDETGITIVALAAKCGITRESLYNKLEGKSEFKASEIHAITCALNLKKSERDKIFFTFKSE